MTHTVAADTTPQAFNDAAGTCGGPLDADRSAAPQNGCCSASRDAARLAGDFRAGADGESLRGEPDVEPDVLVRRGRDMDAG